MNLSSPVTCQRSSCSCRINRALSVFLPTYFLIFFTRCLSHYMSLYFLAYIHPGYFVGFSNSGKTRLMLLVGFNAVAFPLITVLLLKGLGFIQSVFLHTQRDRIIPYITSMTFYFWTQYVLREQPAVPRILVAFMFGVFISSAMALLGKYLQ